MINELYTGYTIYPESSSNPNPNYIPPASVAANNINPKMSESFTLTPRTVLVARVPGHTPMSEMENIKAYLKECFCNNKVVVLWDTVKLSVIEDESWVERMTLEHDYSTCY